MRIKIETLEKIDKLLKDFKTKPSWVYSNDEEISFCWLRK